MRVRNGGPVISSNRVLPGRTQPGSGWLHFGSPRGATRKTVCMRAAGGRRRSLIQSDGQQHLGSALTAYGDRPFPGPAGNKGLPLRILPLGGLGEIGMNCMLVGVYDRFILIDAGLMFPDFDDYGMEKILPDTSFLSQWRHRIEALVVTHGHEDHIGAIPWVLPALDPSTKVYASGFVSELLRNRLKQFNLSDESRLVEFNMRDRINVGPFELEPIRVTHSIPDCCGLILRSEHGTIVHTGDWKIDEDPIDGRSFDREALEEVGKEGVTLLMSDSTNVLSPGRTTSESVVRKSIAEKVLSWDGKGRVISTMFASNLHRIGSLKEAADAANRRLCFMGMSLGTYLDAAFRSGYAPFDPREVIHPSEVGDMNPNEVMILTTGSQGEPYAALNMASRHASQHLKISPEDLILYSAKMIPGNEKRVMKMMNRLSKQGPEIAMGRGELLHTSGHGYREELEEVIKIVQPQHFLPVHGESVFLSAHAEMARELGIQRTMVIHDGDMLGVKHLMRKRTVSVGAMGSMRILGEANLVKFFNDGNNGTGTSQEMYLYERGTLAKEGVVVAAIDVHRPPQLQTLIVKGAEAGEMPTGLRSRVRLTTRAMWTDRGKLVQNLCEAAQAAVAKCPVDSSLTTIEKVVQARIKSAVRKFNKRNADILVIAHEHDPRAGDLLEAMIRRLGLPRSDSLPDSKTNRQPSQRKKTPKQRTQGARSSNSANSGWSGSQGDGRRGTSKRHSLTSKGSTSGRRKKEPLGNKTGNEDASVTVEKKRGRGRPRKQRNDRASAPGQQPGKLIPVPEEILKARREANPRENPRENPNVDLDYG